MKDDRFLIVEELIDGHVYLNQPAGHLERGETLIEAVTRETLEETAWVFRPEYLVGIYQWQHPLKEISYLRFAFYGSALEHRSGLALDEGVLQACWISLDELQARQAQHRSPLVMRCLNDYLNGRQLPLDTLSGYD